MQKTYRSWKWNFKNIIELNTWYYSYFYNYNYKKHDNYKDTIYIKHYNDIKIYTLGNVYFQITWAKRTENNTFCIPKTRSFSETRYNTECKNSMCQSDY